VTTRPDDTLPDDTLPPATDRKPTGAGPGEHALARRVGGQGALLLSGFAGAQLFAFIRNGLIGHTLSMGDFGIAATITLLLQLVDVLSDVGSDRLIVQAPDGDDARLLSTIHAFWICRGIITSLAIYLAAGPVTDWFGISHARWAFEIASLVPLIKGFSHMDLRWHQRRLNNLPTLLYELLPQVAGCLLTLPVLTVLPGFSGVPVIIIGQTFAAVAVSHMCATRPYTARIDRAFAHRIWHFSWPIWLSALPLVAVYHGDRLIIGSLLGMEALAAFSVAFMLTMVPGVIAAKAGNALMLPLLAQSANDAATYRRRFTLMADTAAIAATANLSAFALAGGIVIPMTFGPNYIGLGPLATILAAMWSLRILQTVAGMSLIAEADTRPLLVAAAIRAAGLPLAAIALWQDGGLVGAASAGLAAEVASLIYVSVRCARERTGLTAVLLKRAALLPPVLGLAVVLGFLFGPLLTITSTPWSDLNQTAFALALAGTATVVLGVLMGALLPETRPLLTRFMARPAGAASESARDSANESARAGMA